MERELIFGLKETFMKGIGFKIKCVDTVYTKVKTDESMKEIGKMINEMEREFLFGLMVTDMRDNLFKIKEMDRVK